MMVDIKTEGLGVAPLDKAQMESLLQAEKSINSAKATGEIFLLAVSRRD
ncbi:MAG: hypothetical protein ACYDEQ_00860 [Desulfocucumaceae bacterium]